MQAVWNGTVARRAAIAIGALALAAALGYGVHWLSQTCRPLDRLLGLSGCTDSIRVAGVHPFSGPTMSPANADGVVSFVGRARGPDGGDTPVMVRIELDTGAELARHPLPDEFSILTLWMAFTADGTRGRMAWFQSFASGYSGLVLDLEDATVLESVDDFDSDSDLFAGEPRPVRDDGSVAVRAAGGTRMVRLDRDGNIDLFTADGEPVAALLSAEHRRPRNSYRRPNGLEISPFGGRIALIDDDEETWQTRLHVWDAETGVLLARRILPGYDSWTHAAWTGDETRLAVFRREGPDTLIDLYRWQP